VKQAAESIRQYEKDFLPSLELKGVEACDRQAHEEAKQRLARAQAELDDPSFNVTRVLEMFSQPLLNLWRHEGALSRSMLRTWHELERLQARRAGEHVQAPEVVDLDISLREPPRADIGGTGLSGEPTENSNRTKATGLADRNLQNKAISGADPDPSFGRQRISEHEASGRRDRCWANLKGLGVRG